MRFNNLNALAEAKYATAVGKLDNPTQQKVQSFINEQIEIEMKSMSDVLSATQQQNQKLQFNPLKLWFEGITNIPLGVTDIYFDIEKVKNKGYEIHIRQVGPGTTLETINGNLLDSKTVESQVFIRKDNKSGSIYGSGIGTQSQYTSKLIYKVKTKGMDSFHCWDVLTGKTWFDDKLSHESGVIIEMFVPYSQKMVSYERFIDDLRWMISFYDNKNLVGNNSRTYHIEAQGFDTGGNDRLSLPIHPTATNWVQPDGKITKIPSYTHLTLNKKVFKELPIIVPHDDGDKTVLLTNFKFGKRADNYRKSAGGEQWKIPSKITGDIPQLIVYYKDSKQIAFTLQLRGNSGLTSLNNVTLECEIAKDDLRPFFTSTDKFGDIQGVLKATLFNELRQYLLDRYPDNDLLERAVQLWLYAVIVNDFGGKNNANNLRNYYGWGFLNNMTPLKRTKFVIMEYDSDEGRQDFRIFLVGDTNNKITKFTKSCIIEVKRSDFNRRDTNQSMGYITTTVNATQIVGVSLNIKTKNDKLFKEFFAKANGTGQLTSDIKYDLMEVADWGFEDDVKDSFTSEALVEKNSKK